MLSEDQSASEMSDSESSEYNVSVTPKTRQKRPLPDISVFAEACDCTGVSNRAQLFLLHLCCRVLESSRKMMHHQLLTKTKFIEQERNIE